MMHKNTLAEPSMKEYADKKGKKEVREVRVVKAKNGFVVHVERDDYGPGVDRKPQVYADLKGVQGCLEKTFK